MPLNWIEVLSYATKLFNDNQMLSFFYSYGFVEFEDNRDADDAVYELNGKELCGERVIVEHARGPRRDRDGYGGGYWGGGRSKCSLLQDTLSSPFPWGEVSMWTAQRAILLFHTGASRCV